MREGNDFNKYYNDKYYRKEAHNYTINSTLNQYFWYLSNNVFILRWFCLLLFIVSHLIDVLPVVIELEEQKHGAADEQHCQNDRPVQTRHPVTLDENLVLMLSKPMLYAHEYRLQNPRTVQRATLTAAKKSLPSPDVQDHADEHFLSWHFTVKVLPNSNTIK